MKMSKLNINKKFLKFKIDDNTKKSVLKNSQFHYTCGVRVRMGLFYTDDEYEKRAEKVLKQRLP